MWNSTLSLRRDDQKNEMINYIVKTVVLKLALKKMMNDKLYSLMEDTESIVLSCEAIEPRGALKFLLPKFVMQAKRIHAVLKRWELMGIMPESPPQWKPGDKECNEENLKW